MRDEAETKIAQYRVHTRSPDTPLAALSGGNVQRTVLARELDERIEVMIAANPCFGLDFPAVAQIHAAIIAARNRGVAVLLVSSDLDEILDLADCPPAKLRRGNSALRIGDPGPMGRILIAGEPGNDFVAPLRPATGELVVAKPGKGAFFATSLDALLRERQVTHLAIGGVTTEVCVQTTMREANDRGYECVLVEDATESYFPAFKQATLDMVRAQGAIVGWTATVDQVLAALEVP